MAKSSTQEKERYYLEQFRVAYAAFPKGEVLYGDKPDVIVNAERTVGIEITNLFREAGSLPGSEQVQRVRREMVIAKAQAAYERSGKTKIELKFGFNKSCPITDQKRLVGEIVALAECWERQ
jgi:hypothetical protein